MKLNKEKAEILKEAINEWQENRVITDEQADVMKNSIAVQKFDWKQLTIYAFFIAVVCVVLSLIVLLADKPLRAIIERFTQLTDWSISIILTIATAILLWYTKYRFKTNNNTPFSNNSLLVCTAFLGLACWSYWAKTFHVLANNYLFVFFIATIAYVLLSLYFKSKIIWLMSLLMLTFTYTILGYDQVQFLGMNYPMRYIPFSLLLLVIAYIMYDNKQLKNNFVVHYVYSLLLFYVALWLLSIFGNNIDWEQWKLVKQYSFIVWSLLLFIVSAAGMYFAVKKYDLIVGNISLVFFILNLITRYFEYFWESLHKSIFFMILAIIFWIIGSRAEKLWNLKFLENK